MVGFNNQIVKKAFLHEYNVRHFYWRNYNPKNGSKTSLAFGKDKESYGGNWW
jgi:hypothetical protein